MIVEHWPPAVQEAYILIYNACRWEWTPLPAQCCCWWCGSPRSAVQIPYRTSEAIVLEDATLHFLPEHF